MDKSEVKSPAFHGDKSLKSPSNGKGFSGQFFDLNKLLN